MTGNDSATGRDSNAPGSEMEPGDNPASLRRTIRRWREGQDYLFLMSRTITNLGISSPENVCDTLLSLTGTFLETQYGGVLLCGTGSRDMLSLAAGRDVDETLVLGDIRARELWNWVLSEKVSQALGPEELGHRWPSAPAHLRQELAVVVVEIEDAPRGILFVSSKLSGEPFEEHDLAFLRSASGILALGVTTAVAITAEKALSSQFEARAAEANREALEKARALEDKLQVIEQQRFAIRELSTPVLQIWDDVLALPVIGVVDSSRGADIMERLLDEITRQQSRYVIIDITGVEIVDTKMADHFLKVFRAAELLGVKCILTGIQPAVAQTLVTLGVDLSAIRTLRNLKDGLRLAIKLRQGERENNGQSK